jgi:hypothetical protein
MTSKPIPGIKVKDGKVLRVRRYPAGQRKRIEGQAARLEKQWRAKSK